MKKHVTIRIVGKVQGVFFRASTKKNADAMDISGFVRNEQDGSVYVEAEGEEENLERFIQWCRRGPAHAQVEKCDVTERPLAGLVRFTIQR
jgi:acylphosphatase